MIIYAYVANVSVGRLFLAALLPGLMVAISFMVVNYVIARRRGYPSEGSASVRKVWVTFREAIWALLAPLIILGGILGGVFTPTEAGVVAALYVMLVSAFIYHELTWQHLVNALRRTVVTTARVTFLVSMALLFGLFLIRQQLPQTVASGLLSERMHPLVVLAIINVLLLVLHTTLETASAMLVIVPVLLPLLDILHVDPVQFGIIVLVNSAIGINLPPIGFCLYIACSLSKARLEDAAVAMLPFTVALLVDLALVTGFPSISLALPRVFLH